MPFLYISYQSSSLSSLFLLPWSWVFLLASFSSCHTRLRSSSPHVIVLPCQPGDSSALASASRHALKISSQPVARSVQPVRVGHAAVQSREPWLWQQLCCLARPSCWSDVLSWWCMSVCLSGLVWSGLDCLAVGRWILILKKSPVASLEYKRA